MGWATGVSGPRLKQSTTCESSKRVTGHHPRCIIGPVMQGGAGKVWRFCAYLQLLEFVPFELECVLVNGDDRIELLAICARTRDKFALLGALDHAR